MNETTTTSSVSTILAPLYPEYEEAPLLNPPPYIQTSTAFFDSPVCGFVQTFAYRQSSLYFPVESPKISDINIPALVRFAAEISAKEGPEELELLIGQFGPCKFLSVGGPGTKTEKLTYDVPLSVEVPLYFTGAANRRSPIGGCANGIPKYADTED